MKIKLLLIFLFTSFCTYSQLKFEKGYIIDNGGKKTECYIKNNDWLNNPTEFKYKLSPDSAPFDGTITSIKEFGVYNSFKFRRFSIKIDKSSRLLKEISTTKNFKDKVETMFLKTLIEGKATLYSYNENSVERYFFSSDESAITPLRYKKYLTSDNTVGENNKYKKQLWENLRCDDASLNDIRKMDYEKEDMVDFFIKYNNCRKSEINNFSKKINKKWLNLNIRPGVYISSPSVISEPNRLNIEFSQSLGYRLGIEAEFILPFNNNKWAFIIEPTYQKFEAKDKFVVVPRSEATNTTLDYTSIEIPLGLRHYLFLNENNKLFIDLTFTTDIAIDSKLDFEMEFLTDKKITSRDNFSFGFGYNLKKKYSVQIKYAANRELLGDFLAWNTKYKSLSFILGYNLF